MGCGAAAAATAAAAACSRLGVPEAAAGSRGSSCGALPYCVWPGPALPPPPFSRRLELMVSSRGRAARARRQRVRPAAQGVGRGGGCPVTRRDIFFFLSREELAPGAGVFPARGSGGAWVPGGVELRRSRHREELRVSPEVMTVRRGRRAAQATVGKPRGRLGCAQLKPATGELLQAPGEAAPRRRSGSNRCGTRAVWSPRPAPGGMAGPGGGVPRRSGTRPA